MKSYLFAVAAAAVVLLTGCANDLEVEDTSNREAAPYSPDPSNYLPAVREPDALGQPNY
ncbi:MAG: hypothetical protein M3Y86_11505 [Verrucomicrobiota bacterium]|nr:hypothetical protein [Verrucomicrobiota bacterium]